MRRTGMMGATVGASVAISFWVAYTFFGYTFDTAVLVLWPSSIALLGISDNNALGVIAAVWAASGVLNALLYALLAIGFVALYRLIFHRGRHVA